jgi:hypothetical protein
MGRGPTDEGGDPRMRRGPTDEGGDPRMREASAIRHQLFTIKFGGGRGCQPGADRSRDLERLESRAY